MRRVALVALLIVPSSAAMSVFGWFALADWDALKPAYERFREARAHGADADEVLVAWAAQDIHRLNLAAEGAWFLLAAVVFAIGVHGLCTLPAHPRHARHIPEALVEEELLSEDQQRLARSQGRPTARGRDRRP